MGLDRAVRFPSTDTPSWETICARLARVREAALLRMIDGLPAFPDETPDAAWRELRIGIAGGMVTIRRGPGVLTCVVWDNADPALTAAWEKVLWACAAAGDGQIDTPSGSVSAAGFARASGLSPS